jgi:eukaryotic-like serine/threonine-protein kinase
MDFGIARAISDASSTMTQTAAVVGTAQYLSPEQARGESVDSRSDVYSAGCLLYELLTGRPPFVGDSPVAVAYQHVREPAAPPSDHDTELPPQIDAIVMKALAKRVEDRYQSAGAMRNDIERYLAGHPVHVLPPPPLEPPPTETAPTAVVAPVPPPEEEEEDHGTRPGLLVFLAILLVIVLGLAAYLLPKMFASPGDQVQVPRLAGLTQDQARAALGDAGLTVGTVSRQFSGKVRANRVISQDPAADDFVDKGSTVTFVLSLGTHPTKVPDVIGQTRSQAETAMTSAHLRAEFKPIESDNTQGTVVKTDPSPGTAVGRDTPVTVFLSSGPQKVPDVFGLTQDEAEQKIRERGFVPKVSPDNDSSEPKGTVTGQTPAANQPLPQGSTVFITVSTGEPSSPTTSPSSPSSSPTTLPTSLPTSSPPS